MVRSLVSRRLALFALVAFALVTGAPLAQAGGIRVVDVWARATPPGTPNGAAYMTLVNDGDAVERLVGAATPVAAKAMLHTVESVDGVMKMRHVMAIEIAPGATVKLAPGGFHIMLMKLKAPLVAGTRFPLTLTFENAGTATVEVAVRKP